MAERRPTINWSEWPRVPDDQRPKKLHHNQLISEDDDMALRRKGWIPTDVRLLPNATDADKAESLKAYLEGLRYGTVELVQAVARYVEVEARILGLTSGKGPEKAEKVVDRDEMGLEELLRIGGRVGHSRDEKKKFLDKMRSVEDE